MTACPGAGDSLTVTGHGETGPVISQVIPNPQDRKSPVIEI